MTEPTDSIDRLLGRLAEAGIPTLVLDEDHDVELLVRRRDRTRLRSLLADERWRLRIGDLGAWRWRPTVSYVWSGGPVVHVHHGVPAGPLPPGVLRRLERRLWEGADRGPDGVRRADAAGRRVFLAVQAATPGPWRRRRLAALRSVPTAEPGADDRLATGCGVSATLAWSAAAPDALPRRKAGPLFDRPPGRILWWGASLAVRAVRSRELRGWLIGVPGSDVAPTRVRFADTELELGPGVFVPARVSEPTVELASSELPAGGRMMEVGTGCGAVALSVARRREDVEIVGIDTSERALRWAARNARRLSVSNARFIRGSLLEPAPEALAGSVDVIAVNVPYVPGSRWGPALSDRRGSVIGTGADGLGLVRDAAWQALGYLRPGGRLIVQLTADQWDLFAPELTALGYRPGGIVGRAAADVVAWAELERVDQATD